MINLLENEKIVLQKRRHWYALSTEASGLLMLAFFPFVALFVMLEVQQSRQTLVEHWDLALFLTSFWLLVIWMLFFIVWTNYYLDVLVVTNYRIIDIEQQGLFSRDLVEVHLKNIEDIKIEVLGILPTFLDFGNLYIQTAGESREVIIKRIAHPKVVRDIISKYHIQALNK